MRGSRKSSRSKRVQYDWVMNEDTYGIEASNSVPVAGIIAVPLTYPRFMFEDTFAGFAPATRVQTAFPEQAGRQFVKKVRGEILIRTASWVSGDTLNVTARIVKKPMDFYTGAMVSEPGYDLFEDYFANERFVWQTCIYDTFVAGTTERSKVYVNAPCNQTLEPNEALWLVFDSLNVGGFPFDCNVRMDYLPMLRTLMRAD